MTAELLATKLMVPLPPPHAVTRTRLVDMIEAGVPATRLTVVATPAGYGKTTLLAQWARSTSLAVAWLTVDQDDNDPDRFLRCLLHAWATLRPDVRQSRLGVLLGSPQPDRDEVLAAFVNVASELDTHVAFVIDDYHRLTNPAVHEALTFILDHLPPMLHLVAAGRNDPPLALARRRARSELLELRAGDLRFDEDETGEFLTGGMTLDLGGSAIATLHQRMEGWITGLQLVALGIRQGHGARMPASLSGRHRYLADYLGEEVLAGLPAETRTFLLETGIVDQVCAPLCQAITGNPQSQELLVELERSNLFLQSLDDDRTWFRYHPIFADVLVQELHRQRDDVDVLHVRAATWYLERDMPEQAFRHALLGNDIDLASRVVEIHTTAKMFNGEVSVVAGWFAALPEPWLSTRPNLMLAHATFRLISGQPDIAVGILGQLEALPVQQDNAQPSVARTNALRCFMACFRNDLAQAVTHANRAFQELPPDDFIFRANIYHALGDTYRSNRRWDEARDNYLRVFEIAPLALDNPQAHIILMHSYGAMADLALRQGLLREAGTYWRLAREAIEAPAAWGHYPLPVTGWIYTRLAELAYEHNDLSTARDRIAAGLERADLGGEPQSLIATRVIKARIDLTDGLLDSADALLNDADDLLKQAAFPDWIGKLERCRVDLWLARGESARATAWAGALLDAQEDEPLADERHLAAARALVASPSPALHRRATVLLDRLAETAAGQGLLGVRIEALALMAIDHDRHGNRAAMLTALEASLRIAEPEGYVRLFADLGPAMTGPLREARTRGVMPDYVDTILAASGALVSLPGQAVLVEPLSARELEVLQLMAAGLSNREIAQSLYVSPETIKKHTGNIYGKLGVRGRMEAVSRARSLALIAGSPLPGHATS